MPQASFEGRTSAKLHRRVPAYSNTPRTWFPSGKKLTNPSVFAPGQQRSDQLSGGHVPEAGGPNDR